MPCGCWILVCRPLLHCIGDANDDDCPLLQTQYRQHRAPGRAVPHWGVAILDREAVGSGRFFGQLRLAEIVYHDVQYHQEGVRADHQLAPFLWIGLQANYSPRTPFFQVEQ